MLTKVETHYDAFRKHAEANLAWTGFAPQSWAQALPEVNAADLPDRSLTRSELRAFCHEAATTDESAFVACMAWGGMKRGHGKAAWARRQEWLHLVASLRSGVFTREEAYRAFNAQYIPGLGPAYFTKLIYFLRPEVDGYILDQWTAKSVSLVFEPIFIEINSSGWVVRANDADVYRRYCEAVEWIAFDCKTSGEVAEQMLFSRGGRSKHPWRDYVVKNWSRRKTVRSGGIPVSDDLNGPSQATP